MSKLAIVLCATAFFASAFDLVPEVSEENSISRGIDMTIQRIDHRCLEIHHEVTETSLETIQPLMEIMMFYKNKLDMHYQLLQSTVDTIITSRTEKVINEEECRRHFENYKNLPLVQSVPLEVVQNVSNEFAKLMIEAKETKETLINLKASASRANETELVSYFEQRDQIYRDFDMGAELFLHYNSEVVNGKVIQEKLKVAWDTYVKMGMDVVDKIFKCASTPCSECLTKKN